MKKLLLIEDDALVANMYANKLRVEGFDVVVAKDGEQGIDMMKSNPPDIVILDLMLPKIQGLDIIKWIRMQPAFLRLPIIVFSNSFLSTLIQSAWKAGANHCLIKSSCPPRQLVEVIKKALSNPPAAPKASPEVSSANLPALRMTSPATPAAPVEKPAGVIPFRFAEQLQKEITSEPSAKPMRVEGSPPLIPFAGFQEPVKQAEAPAEDSSDAGSQLEIRQAFLDAFPQNLATIRSLLMATIKAEHPEDKKSKLTELYGKIHSLTSNASLTGLQDVARMTSALEAFLKDLHEKPEHVNPSVHRTLAQTIDFLVVLVGKGTLGTLLNLQFPRTLVVDDEAISRRAIVFALDKAGLKCVTLDDPTACLQMAAESSFDLIVTDVEMPQMNGFELCKRIRALPTNVKTPILFVTGLSDFESRAKSTLSGGNDLIAKPFLFMELAVKALTHIYKAKLAAA